MEYYLQFGRLRISLGVLTETIQLGISMGYSVDEFAQLHRSLNIGLIFISLNFILFNEEAH
jgi:hypothetical protein